MKDGKTIGYVIFFGVLVVGGIFAYNKFVKPHEEKIDTAKSIFDIFGF